MSAAKGKSLGSLLKGVARLGVKQARVIIRSLAHDSREAGRDSLFAALPSART